MARMARQLGTLVLLALVWPAAFARAQAPPVARAAPRRAVVRLPQSVAPSSENEPISTPTPEAEDPQILRSLPDLPSEPRSLFAPAPPIGPPPPDFERPYFQRDPLLDPANWPQPGWFTDVDLGAIKPHVSYAIANPIQTLLNATPTVQVGSAHLNWVVAPRFEIGYRLPSGFGEISVSDRFFNTGGSDNILVPDGPAHRSSTFFLNYTDIDYGSREFMPWQNWSLKFRGGLRFAQTSFSTRLDESFAEAAAGSGVFSQTQSNRSGGGGSHFGFELDRRFPGRGLTLVSQADVSDLFMRTTQTAVANLTTVTPAGGFDAGSFGRT
ncbi:MAG TPA: hypothetical protein VG125_21070, partial [Pirellulales bacterium]|nr:hypothetical protein [Pirellulales bacterium]